MKKQVKSILYGACLLFAGLSVYCSEKAAFLASPCGNSNYPSITSGGTSLYLAWLDNREGASNIYFKKSDDEGVTWTEETRLTGGKKHKCYPPALDLNSGYLNMAWVDYGDNVSGEIRYLRSSDFGNTWDREVVLVEDANNASVASIRSYGDKIHLSWLDSDGRIYFKTSSDRGETWGKEILLDRKANYEGGALSSSILADREEIICCWSDIRYDMPGLKIWLNGIAVPKNNTRKISSVDYKTSGDGGVTWSEKKSYMKYFVAGKNSGLISSPALLQLEETRMFFWIKYEDKGNSGLFCKVSENRGRTWDEEASVHESAGRITYYSLCRLRDKVIVVCAETTGDKEYITTKILSKDMTVEGYNQALSGGQGAFNWPALAATGSDKLHLLYFDDYPDEYSRIHYQQTQKGSSNWVEYFDSGNKEF